MIVKHEEFLYLERRIWDVDDDYIVVPEFQVLEESFTEGCRVKVTVTLAGPDE